MPLRRFGPVLMLLSLVACGGGDDTPPTLPPPSSAPPQSSQNPCVAALAQASAEGVASTVPVAAAVLDKGPRGLAADQRPVAELLWRSALAARATNRAAPAPDAVSQDVGDIAVIGTTARCCCRATASTSAAPACGSSATAAAATT